MEPITMKFLRVAEENDICNLLLKNMDIANWNGDVKIIFISMYSF